MTVAGRRGGDEVESCPPGLDADYAEVQAGFARRVLTNRRSAGGRHRVVLIEAGVSDRHPWIYRTLLHRADRLHRVAEDTMGCSQISARIGTGVPPHQGNPGRKNQLC